MILVCMATVLACLVVIGLLYFGLIVLTYAFPKTPIPDPAKMRIAFVGDSITFGRRLPFTSERSFPRVIGKNLGADYQVLNFGKSGRTLQKSGDMPYLRDKLYRASLECRAMSTVIMLGTNDSKPQNWDSANYERELGELIDVYRALDHPPSVILMTPPAVFVRKGRTSPVFKIIADVIRDEVRPIVLRVARDKGVASIDLWDETKDHPDWFRDGVHPNKPGTTAIGTFVLSRLEDLAVI
ncbi:MAG TPA: GDSL-type esterase/lipase family protein [Planctomycetaceae bacterium]|jgi:lysophospholipase L1-like esterase